MKKNYFILFVFLLLSSTSVVKAQLNYNDIVDKALQRGQVLDIYMAHPTGGGQSDFLIFEDKPADYADTSHFRLRFLAESASYEVLCSDTFVKVLNSGDVIDETSATWVNNPLNKWFYMCNYGTVKIGGWQTVSNKFIGVKMVYNGNTMYGWIQLSVTPNPAGQPTTTIYDMAYQATDGKGIKAGQTVGVEHRIINDQNYLLNNRQLKITNSKLENVSIYDISGKQLLNTVVKNDKVIDLSSFINGIYILKLKGSDYTLTKKISIQ